MRIYNNMKEMVSEESRNLFELGMEVQSSTMQDKDVRDDENFLTKELINNSFCVKNIDVENLHKIGFEYLKKDFNQEWANAEFEERVSRQECNPGTAYKKRIDVWKEFLHDGKFSYTYPDRIRKSIQVVIDEIIKNPTSRQLIIPIFSFDDIKKYGKERIPCSMFYQFILRGGNLHLIYIMRSSDLLTHFINDVYIASRILQYVANHTIYATGNLYMNISSFHAYKKDLDKLKIY